MHSLCRDGHMNAVTTLSSNSIMFDQWFFGINGTPKKLEQRFLSFIFQHRFPLLERMKDGRKLLPLVTSFALQSLDLFKHYDLILASKNGFILKCWHWLLIYHFPTLTPSYDMFFKPVVFPTCFSKLSSFELTKSTFFNLLNKQNILRATIHHCYPSTF
jgi:hypothetical protein